MHLPHLDGLFPPAPLPNPGVVCALPSLTQQPKAEDASAATIKKKATVNISVKTQITHPKTGVIHFVPTALRVHHEYKWGTAVPQRRSQDDSAVLIAKAAPRSSPSIPVSVQTKDNAYEVLMIDMKGLL